MNMVRCKVCGAEAIKDMKCLQCGSNQLEPKPMPEDLVQYPQLTFALAIDETGAYGEPPTPIHQIKFYENDQEYVTGHGVTVEAAILNLVESVKTDLECKFDAKLKSL